MTRAADQGQDARDVWLNGSVRLLGVPRFDDDRGSLVPLEYDELPFAPRRLFTVKDAPAGTVRGRHALLNQTQLLICVTGRIDVQVRFRRQLETITLDQPQTGLLIGPGVWSSQEFVVDNTVLVALASGPYDSAEYATEASP